MRFNYFFQTGCYTRCDHEGNVLDNDDEGYNFDYEVDDFEALDKIPEIMADDREIFPEDANGEYHIPWKQRYIIAKNIVSMIEDLGSTDELLERYYDDLKDVFYDEAMESEQG